MKKIITKKFMLIAAILIMALSMTTGGFAANEAEAESEIVADTGVEPYSYYMRDKGISFSIMSGRVDVNFFTYANQSVEHIYHDVTIYKNGIWQLSNRYENWGVTTLQTTIPVYALSGDYIDVYADHYVEHYGITEGYSSSNNMYY